MLINQILKRFQQRVIYYSKWYSFRFTLFSIAVFIIKSNFVHFLLGKMFRESSCLEPWFHIVQMSFKIYLIIACPANPECLAKNNGTFGVVWMSRCIVQVLMFACRRNVQVCGQLTSRQAHFKVQKGNAFFIERMGKFNVGMVIIEIFLRTLPVFFYHVSK